MLARLSQLEESRSRRMDSDENRGIVLRVFSGKEFKSTVSRFSGFVDYSISTADKVNQRVAFRKWEEDLREYALLSRLGMSVELIMNSLGEEPRTILRAWDGFEGSVGHTVAVMAAAKAEKAMQVLRKEYDLSTCVDVELWFRRYTSPTNAKNWTTYLNRVKVQLFVITIYILIHF